LSTCLSAHKDPEEVTKVDNSQEVINIDDEDDNIDGNANDFLPGSNDSDGKFELGHEATGSSPLALSGGTNKSIGISNNPHKTSLFATNSPTTSTCSANPAGTPNPKSPPPKRPSALRTSSFTPVVNNGVPTIDDAVDDDPDFFEGTNQDGSGEGLHFILVSFIKDKTKIRDQLLKALADTVNIICNNLPNTLIHCIQAERGFAAGAVLFDLGGNGAFWKKGCNAPRATNFREKRNPPQADSIR
jgi:hypothetical protein